MSFVSPKYQGPPRRLDEAEAPADPVALFRAWFAEAQAAVRQPEGMTLATATPDGRPSARMVLLRGLDARGFVFFTNYESRKGLELAENPRAALVFFWEPLDRQVRVEGRVERLADDESDAYFASRPRGHRLGAWASPQSRTIAERSELEALMHAAEARFEGAEVPRPPYWGGFRVVPDAVEFWQGQLNRLHDRLRYVRTEAGSWRRERLAP
jgi:pyridoxamine 5'-phosphate oxidase